MVLKGALTWQNQWRSYENSWVGLKIREYDTAKYCRSLVLNDMTLRHIRDGIECFTVPLGTGISGRLDYKRFWRVIKCFIFITLK